MNRKKDFIFNKLLLSREMGVVSDLAKIRKLSRKPRSLLSIKNVKRWAYHGYINIDMQAKELSIIMFWNHWFLQNSFHKTPITHAHHFTKCLWRY